MKRKLKLLRCNPRRAQEGGRKKAQRDDRYAPPVLELAIGSRVAVNENIAVSLGLYRGALWTVLGFVFDGAAPAEEDRMAPISVVATETEGREIPIVLVRMDDHFTGPSCIKGDANIVPFYAMASRRYIEGKCTRFQLPLVPAYARTIHKAQGLTAKHGLVLAPEARGPLQ